MQTILIIEDDPNDAELLKRGLRGAEFAGNVVVARDGNEALDYIEGRGAFSDRGKYPLPNLIVLDWILPNLSGIEVLTWLKGHPLAGDIPVFVLTGSPYYTAVSDAYRLGAKSFFFKPLDGSQIATLLGALR